VNDSSETGLDRRMVLKLAGAAALSSACTAAAAEPGARPPGGKHGSVRSADGTEIGYTRFGQGAPVVVVHGTLTVQDDWAAFAQKLGATRTVYLYDRRGRGRSPDLGKPYSLDREIDDLVAMVNLAGPGVAILGHSFGGGCALAYALREKFAGRLMLYEPMNSIPAPIAGDRLPRMRTLIEQKQLDAALEYALENIVRLSKHEIEMFKKAPLWPGMVAMAPACLNEFTALDTIKPSVADAGSLRARVWLLLGTESPHEPNRTRSAALVDRIPGLTLYPVPGQGHVAYLLDPSLLAKLVARCLADV